MSTALQVAAWVLVLLSFGLASQLPTRITTEAIPPHVPEGAAQALSSYLVIAGLGGSALAVTVFPQQASISMAAALLGLVAAGLSGWYLHRISSPNDALTHAFGPDWNEQIPTERTGPMLQRRWRWALPSGPAPRWERGVVYWKLPETDRELLADVWQPPAAVAPSGLAFIYLHGGSYQMLDKDRGTRPLFRHLARQGHVVIDIGYRLLDETDIVGMVGDVKRGIAWMKDHAAGYGVNPERIVVAGGSAGREPRAAGRLHARPPAADPRRRHERHVRPSGRRLLRSARLVRVLPAPWQSGPRPPTAGRDDGAGPAPLPARLPRQPRRPRHARHDAHPGAARPAAPHRRRAQTAPAAS